MKLTPLFFALLFRTSSMAQDCTEATILQKPGLWKENNAVASGIAPTDVVKEKKVVAALHEMIKSKFTPMGVLAEMNGGYSSPQSWMPVNDYTYSIIPLNYYCDGNNVKTAGETSTYFSIAANRLDVEIFEDAQGDRLLAEGYNVMDDMPIEKDGYWYFKEIDAPLGFGMTGRSRAWIITYDGKLPYAYVSKKEFLEKRKEILSTQLLDASQGFKDVLERNEIEKGFKEKEYENDPAKLTHYMKMDYLPSKERYEKLLADNEKNYKPAFLKIENLLKMPVSELSQPAIVKQDSNDHLSYLFTDDNDPFGKILIKPNPAYFNKKLPRSSPQFFWVYVRGNHKEKIATSFTTEIVEAVDFAAMKNMLGK